MRMRKAKLFSKIDLKSGFWQVSVREKDRHKAAFRVGDKVYQWKVMPFGLKNSPATFQRIIDDTLGAKYGRIIRGEFCYGYCDDIIIFSDNWHDHLQHTETAPTGRPENQPRKM